MSFPAQLAWLFLSLRGRCGRAAAVLASLLLFVTQFFLLWRFLMTTPPLPVDGMVDPYALDFGSNGWGQLFMAFSFVKAWCNIAIAAKRLHDMNMPGLLAVATIFFDIGAILFLALFRGTNGPNRYGSEPNRPF